MYSSADNVSSTLRVKRAALGCQASLQACGPVKVLDRAVNRWLTRLNATCRLGE